MKRYQGNEFAVDPSILFPQNLRDLKAEIGLLQGEIFSYSPFEEFISAVKEEISFWKRLCRKR